MLFDRNFDEALWCILEGDAENRGEIVEFLNKIPEKLIENIKNILKCRESDAQEEVSDYEGSIVTDDETIYSFALGFAEGEKVLEIKQSFAGEKNNSCIDLDVELNLVKETIGYKSWGYWIGNFTKSSSIVKTACEDYSKEVDLEYGVTVDRKALSRFSSVDVERDVFPININEKPVELTLDYINRRYGEPPKTKNLI